MDQMAERIMKLLEKFNSPHYYQNNEIPAVPLSFIVIVPAWDNCAGIELMTHSKFTRPYPGDRLTLEKKKHEHEHDYIFNSCCLCPISIPNS
jgi:hypothetical protein